MENLEKDAVVGKIPLLAANDQVVIKLINNDISKVNNVLIPTNSTIWYGEVVDKGVDVEERASYMIGDILVLSKNPTHYIFNFKGDEYVIIDDRERRGHIKKDDFKEFLSNAF